MKKKLICFLALVILCFGTFVGCADPYRGYVSSGLEVKEVTFDDDSHNTFDAYNISRSGTLLVSDYDVYTAYHLDFGYTESFFNANELLIFVTVSCTSDGMEFEELLLDGSTLYPLFYRNKIGDNEPVTDDIIFSYYCVELNKANRYCVGQILYRYR